LDLINKKVKHKKFGIGAVKSFDMQYIIVEFQHQTMKFQYPDAFKSFLTAEDQGVQAWILQETLETKDVIKANNINNTENRCDEMSEDSIVYDDNANKMSMNQNSVTFSNHYKRKGISFMCFKVLHMIGNLVATIYGHLSPIKKGERNTTGIAF